MSAEREAIERVWRTIVGLVMDTRGDWRRKVVEATGLPFTRTRALRRLARGPLTLGALAESLGVDAPAATVTVNDLERRGLVTRQEHPEDRRAKIVALTAAGRTTVRAEKNVSDPVPELLASLSREDVKTLVRIFEGSGTGKARAASTRSPKGS